MPEDPTPDGQGILNKPLVKPFPEPTPDDGDKDASRSLVSPAMEEPAETNRPPLGN
ncbi:MAG: hypothetical protein Q8M91_04220 [Polaromonas sp.]|nr:hypothetical protein [Polaromonas sp.]MDP3411675.1 hypothetical protein [Polaromonas sp.]MDP3604756.1 hypothetical protein [Polaromonas sp.]